MGGCVFVESLGRGANSPRAVLRRLVVCTDPDHLQSAHPGIRERRVSARREGLQESETSSGHGPAYFVSDSLRRAVLSHSVCLLEPSRPDGPPDLLPYRLDHGCAVPAGVRSVAAVRRESDSVASRISSVTTGNFRVGQGPLRLSAQKSCDWWRLWK